ncbi:CoA transferase [Nocardia jiangxiensis]|uniref:CoA transferase n=1 Tax=Nocardia jiangxiensis TaxID=282685 RepID=A0ABW6SAI6_9NOCA
MTDQILHGIRIVDLTTGLAGPMATRMLAENGADVVKVESYSGDPVRARAAFATLNRSKRSVVLNVDTTDGRSRLGRLLTSADVVVHDFPPRIAARYGLDDRSATERFPSLIVASVLGYPPNHPDNDRPADDLLVQARSGLMGETWGNREGPIPLRFPLPSWAAASLLASGIITRLIVRRATGRGGSVHTSLLQGMLATASLSWNQAERPIPELISDKYECPPQLAEYECADGVWLQLMNPAERINIAAIPLVHEVMAESGGVEDLTGVTNDALRRVISLRSSAEWLPAFRAADLAVEPCLALGEVLRDVNVVVNGYITEVDDPQWGPSIQAGLPFVTEPVGAVRAPAPTLGQHTDEVFGTLIPRAVSTTVTDLPRLPLAGLKVLDLGSFLAGPMAPMLLADLGADVVKIEPVEGDRVRWKPIFWEACSRNKRSLAVDIRTEEGRDVLRRLVEWADVVHHNQRPRAAAKLGIDEAGLRAINPEIIYAHVASYGSKGPRADSPGFDSIFQALGGWNIENGGTGGLPQFSRFGVLDIQTALLSLVGTLLAVYHRADTGVSGTTNCSLLRTTTVTQSETLIRLADDSIAPYPRFDATQTGTGPGNRIYATDDGWIAVVAESDELLAALLELAGVTHIADIEAALAVRKSDELLAALDATGIRAEFVREAHQFEFFDNQDNVDAQLVVGYEHHHFGHMIQPGSYWMFGDFALRFDRAAPVIGQHTREILAQLGFDEAAIDRMYAAGVAGGPSVPAFWEHG